MSDRAHTQAERLRAPELAALWARARDTLERHPNDWRVNSVDRIDHLRAAGGA